MRSWIDHVQSCIILIDLSRSHEVAGNRTIIQFYEDLFLLKNKSFKISQELLIFTRISMFFVIVGIARDKNAFFAELLYKCLNVYVPNHRQLIRLILTRSEIDLDSIKDAFKRRYDNGLEVYILVSIILLYGNIIKCIKIVVLIWNLIILLLRKTALEIMEGACSHFVPDIRLNQTWKHLIPVFRKNNGVLFTLQHFCALLSNK